MVLHLCALCICTQCSKHHYLVLWYRECQQQLQRLLGERALLEERVSALEAEEQQPGAVKRGIGMLTMSVQREEELDSSRAALARLATRIALLDASKHSIFTLARVCPSTSTSTILYCTFIRITNSVTFTPVQTRVLGCTWMLFALPVVFYLLALILSTITLYEYRRARKVCIHNFCFLFRILRTSCDWQGPAVPAHY